MSSLIEYGWQWGKIGWLGAFVYMVGAALRLARFNARISVADKRYFQGLPSPAAAAVIAGFVWVCFDAQISGTDVSYVALLLTVIIGVLMISNFSYYSFKDIDLRHRVPFVALLVIVLVFVFASIDPPKVLFGTFLLYALSGPALGLLRRSRKKNRAPDA